MLPKTAGQSEERYNATQLMTQTFLIPPKTKFTMQLLNSGVLAASQRLNRRMQCLLADNQWQIEVERWNNTSLTSIKEFPIDVATGPSDPVVQAGWALASGDIEGFICQNQVS